MYKKKKRNLIKKIIKQEPIKATGAKKRKMMKVLKITTASSPPHHHHHSPQEEEQGFDSAAEEPTPTTTTTIKTGIIKSIVTELKSAKRKQIYTSDDENECTKCNIKFNSMEFVKHLENCREKPLFQCRLCWFPFDTKESCHLHLQKQHGQIDRDLLAGLIVENFASSSEEPLDLSMDAVDLSNKKKTIVYPNIITSPFISKKEVYSHPQQQMGQLDYTPSFLYSHPFQLPTFYQPSLPPLPSIKYEKDIEKSPTTSIEEKSEPLLETKNKKKKVENNNEYQKPKQRRYRTERPFACPHCPARFTLRSNMERHGKHQHPSVWQRSPSNRVINRQQKAIQPPPTLLPQQQGQQNNSNSKDSNLNIRQIISQQLKRKLSNNNIDDLISVNELIDGVNNNFNTIEKEEHVGGSGGDEDDDEEGDEEEESGDGEEESGEGGESESEESASEQGKKKSAYSSAPHKISCPHCSRRFPWTSSLRRHLLTHTGQKPYQCLKCPLLFTTKSNCDRHLARKHNGGDDTNVDSSKDEEDEDESEEEEQQKNQSQNSEDASFRCHLCDVSSPTRSTILSHIEAKHPVNYKVLISKGILENQQPPTSDSEETNRKIICTFCLNKFWSVEDLRRHMRSHTGEKPFNCKYCLRKFTLKHSMLRHEKKHEKSLLGELVGLDDGVVDEMLDRGGND